MCSAFMGRCYLFGNIYGVTVESDKYWYVDDSEIHHILRVLMAYEKKTFAARLRRNVIINITLAMILLVCVVLWAIFVRHHRGELEGFVTEEKYIEKLTHQVSDAEQGVLRLIALRGNVENNNEMRSNFLKITSINEDIGISFDDYASNVSKRGDLTSSWLLLEFEPILNMLRADIDEIISLCKKGDYAAANTYYFKFMNVRTRAIRHLITDGKFFIDKDIQLYENELRLIEYYSLGAIVVLILLAICYFYKHNGMLTDTISYPMEMLAYAMSMFAMGEYSYRVKIESEDEFGELGEVFNSMFDVLELTRNELVEAKEEAEMLQGKLIESNKMATLGEMSSGIAHELSQPLGAILLKSQFVAKLILKGDSDRAVSVADQIKEQTIRAKKIMDSLRVFSREACHDDREVCEFNDIVREVMVLFEDEMRFENISVEFLLCEQETSVCVSRVQIGQILTNLIANARDAVLSVEKKCVRLLTWVENKFVVFEVIDNGYGIKDDIVAKIFEPFFTTKPVGKGTGLGLSMSYSMVHENDGDIIVQSEVGKGSKFRLVFPFRKAA